MARRPKGGGDKKVLFSKLDQIWSEVAVSDWLLLVSELRPEGRWKRSGPHVKGCCPFHDDPGPSFCITPVSPRGSGIATCFGCRRFWTNPVAFVAEMKKCSHGDAIMFLRKRFSLKALIPDALYEKVRDHERHQNMKNKLADFMSDQLMQAIRIWPDELELTKAGLYWAKPTIEYLMSRKLGECAPNELRPVGETTPEGPDPWGIWAAICGSQLLGVLPPLATVQGHFGSDSDEFKFYSSYFDQVLSEGAKWVGAIVFGYHDGPKSVCRFKLRVPSPEVKDFIFIDDAYKAEMNDFRGYFGLNFYRTFLGPKTPDDPYTHTVNAFEGEFDSLSSIAQQIRRGQEDFFALSLGGASAQACDKLVSFGVSQIRIVPDDDHGGVEFAKNCLDRTKVKTLSFEVFEWPDEYRSWVDPTDPNKRIKDADEAVKALGYPKWCRHVLDKENYVKLHMWCFDQARNQIARSAVNDVRQQSRIAQEWGAYITDNQELKRFCDNVAKVYDLDATILSRDISAKDEDEEAFIERLGRVLEEHFYPVGVQNAESRKKLLVLYNKDTRKQDVVTLNDERAVETLLSTYFGALYEFVRDHVGDPSFLALEGEEMSLPIPIKIKKYREYLTLALLRMAKGLPALDAATARGQGLHLVEVGEGTMRSYVVNGREVYHLDHKSDGSFTASLLDGPSHEGVVFNNDGPAWMPSLDKQLIEANVDVVELYNRIRTMIDLGWSWKHQALDATFLAAYLMCLSVMTVFHRQTALFVTGEFQSGKSRFVGGLISGHEFPRMQLVAHSTLMNVYTPASIRQERNNSPLALCLEEFEDYGNNEKKSVNVRGVLEMTRDLISESVVKIAVGTTTGEPRHYYLRFPMICSAIKPLRDAASLSRFITFELTHDSRRIDPQVALLDAYGEVGMRATRRDLAVGLMRHMPGLHATQTEVEREFATGALMPAHAQARFREALYPVLTMLKFLRAEAEKQGRADVIPEYKRFAMEFADSRKDQLARLKATTENEQIFETLLSSVIHVQNDSSQGSERMGYGTTIRIMLADLNKLEDINKTKKGVYLDTKMEWLIVNWIEAKQGVLLNTNYKYDQPGFLKQISERSPHHVSQDDVRSSRVLDRLVDVMGPCQKLELISAFSVRHLLDAARKRREEGMSGVAAGLNEAKADESSTAPQQSDDIIA